jgi:hypothetical protein
MMADKTIKAYAVIDWRNESVKARKTKPNHSELGSNELMAILKFPVTIPDVDIPTLAAEIEVPEPMVHSATLEALEDREMPDWATTADEVISNHLDALREAANPGPVIDTVVLETLRDARGRPKIENVEEYVKQAVAEIEDN